MTRSTIGIVRAVAASTLAALWVGFAPTSDTSLGFPGQSAFAQQGQQGQMGQGGRGRGGPEAGQGQNRGSRATTPGVRRGVEDLVLRGQRGPSADSDRPAWAGVKGGKAGAGGRPPGAGVKKGDLYGDLYTIIRDENGEPVLVDGYPQVLAYVKDADGNLLPLVIDGYQVVIPRDAEGNLLTTVTVNGTTYTVFPSEVDFGRTSVARAPTKVLEKSLSDVLALINAPGAVLTVDASGRLVINGTTVDSPLANLALYVELMSPSVLDGSITATLPSTLDAAALLAGAADKTGSITVDYVVYLNSILRINTVVDGTTTAYYDFSSYSYDRLTTWKDVTATVLILKDGVYVPTVVNVYDVVFASTDWTDTTTGGADDFAQAADDYLAVIAYLHDNAVR